MNSHQEQLARIRAQRESHIIAWRGSGATQAAYCRAHGLNATTFSGWLCGRAHVKSAAVSTPALSSSPTLTRAAKGVKGAKFKLSSMGTSHAGGTLTVVPVHINSSESSTLAKHSTAPESGTLCVQGQSGWRIRFDDLQELSRVAALLSALDCAYLKNHNSSAQQ